MTEAITMVLVIALLAGVGGWAYYQALTRGGRTVTGQRKARRRE